MLFFVTPSFRDFAPTAYIDLGLATFITAAIACLDRARERPALIFCAGLAFGAALGSKYLALAFLPLLVAWAAYRTRSGALIARFTTTALITGAPWYLYNWVSTGNPVSPFAGDWFGHWRWTADDLARQARHLTRETYNRSLAGLLSLPYHLITEPQRFNIPPLPLFLLAGLIAFPLLPWWNRTMRPYGIMTLTFILGWFLSTPYFRYLTAILPLWCLVSVWSIGRALWFVASLVDFRQTIPEVTRRCLSHAVGAILIISFQAHFWRHSHWLDQYAITERVIHRERFLREALPVYGAAEHLRHSGVQDETIFAWPPGPLFAYARGNQVVGDFFGLMGIQQFKRHTYCPERIVDQFQQDGVSILVLSNSPGWVATWNEYFSDRLTTEYKDQHATIYRIDSDTQPRPQLPHSSSKGSVAKVIPYFPLSPDGGVVREKVHITNHSNTGETIEIQVIDDAGRRQQTVAVKLGPRETRNISSDQLLACVSPWEGNLELGNNQEEDWWLALATDLDIEALSHFHTNNGIANAMHQTVRPIEDSHGRVLYRVPFFNPDNDRSQISHLRLVNPSRQEVDVKIAGRDDTGGMVGEEVHISVPGGAARWLSASELESGVCEDDGTNCGIVSGRLGPGQERWRLSVTAMGNDLQVLSLLTSASGQPVNVSASASIKSGTHDLPLFYRPDANDEPQGLLRIINHSDASGTVEIEGIDDTGSPRGSVTLTIGPQQSVHLSSADLEAGNGLKDLSKGLVGRAGLWRLQLDANVEIEALAYAQIQGRIITALHEVAKTIPSESGETHYVPFFNPGRILNHVSWLRLSNAGRDEVDVRIEGTDSSGRPAPQGMVSLNLPAGQSCMLSAQALEAGKPQRASDTCTDRPFDFDGRLGKGIGNWSLFVTAQGSGVQVQSLMRNAAGHLVNLSSTNRTPTHGKYLDYLPDAAIAQLERWGPQASVVGEPFNLQPNGNSALWFLFRKLERHSDYVIYVDSQPAITRMQAEQRLITAALAPDQWKRLVSTQGKVPIHLVEATEGKQLLGYFHIRRE